MLLVGLVSCNGIESKRTDEATRYWVDRSAPSPLGGDVISFQTAQAHVGPLAEPLADDTPDWEWRPLPDLWSRVALGDTDDVWYRIDFDLSARPDELWALYLPRVRMNAAAWVNGVSVGSGGRFGSRVTRNWNRPLYFAVPNVILRPGQNRIHLRVGTSRASDIRLVGVELGPDALLRPHHDARLFRQVDLRYQMIALTLATALLVVVVALLRPEIKGAIYYGIALLCLALASSDGVVRDPPMPTLVWQWLNTAFYLVGCACVIAGTNRALEIETRSSEWIAWFGVIAAGGVTLVDPYYFVTVNLGLLAIGIATAIYTVFRILEGRRRGTLRRGYVLLALALGTLGLVVHDFQSGFTGIALPYAPLTTFVPLVIVAFTVWILVGVVLETLATTERLAENLNARVAVARDELRINYEQLRELERSQLVQQERDRLMREMHDGIGGQIVSTLALLDRQPPEPQEAGDSLREVLYDMRQMLDSVAATEDLASLLGSMRARLERRLSRHGIRFDWRVRNVPALPGLGPSGMSHVMRIVQESIANVVRHARARTIRIETREAAGPDGASGVVLEIEDDGCGMSDIPPRATSRGISNLRSRAADLGGTIEFRSTPSGTQVRLWLPL